MHAEPMTHPAPAELTAYALGKLNEADTAAVARHLEACDACRKAVETVPPDSFVSMFRAAKDSAPATAVAGLLPELAEHPRFRIVRELGQGGMGVVYLAEHRLMERLVAIKVIHHSFLDHPDALERFHREVRAAAKLDHRNIVRAHDAEQAGALHMLVMEYVEGQSLAQVLERKGPLPVLNACHYARQAALGLQEAFEKGMVHRDLKPQNLMLTPKGAVKILDFGLARLASERQPGKGLTQENAVMGTPEYIAPEQATDARKADIRADIYSLGCTLYCLLAGRPPFAEETVMKTILAHLDQEAVPLHELRSDVPAELSAVVARMMAKDPAQRYQTPAEVTQALTPFCKAGAKTTATPTLRPVAASSTGTLVGTDTDPTPAVRARKTTIPEPESSPWEELAATAAAPLPAQKKEKEKKQKQPTAPAPASSRRWWLLGGGAAAAVLLTLGVLWLTGVIFKVKTPYGTVVLEIDQPDAEVFVDGKKINVTVPGDNEPVQIEVMEGTRELRVTKGNLKVFSRNVTLQAGKMERLKVALIPTRVPVPTPEPDMGRPGLVATFFEGCDLDWKRKTTIHQQINFDWGDGSPDPDVPKDLFSIRWEGFIKAPKPGRYKLITESDDGIRLWLDSILIIDEWHEHVSKPHTGEVELTGALQPIRIEYFERGSAAHVRLRWEKLGEDGFPQQLVPREVLFHSQELLEKAQRPQMELKAQILWNGGHSPGQWFESVAFSPDGSLLVAAGTYDTIKLWDVKSGKELKHPFKGNKAVFSRDGRYILSACGDKVLRLWDVPSRQFIRELKGHTDTISCVAFSPVDSHVALSAGGSEKDTTVRVWDVERGVQLVAIDYKKPVPCVAFFPDGQRFVVCGGYHPEIQLHDRGSNRVIRSFPNCPASRAIITPCGQRLLTGNPYAGPSDHNSLWDLNRGNEPVRLFHKHRMTLESMAFSPDGRHVVSGGWDKEVRLWELETGRELCRFDPPHEQTVWSVAFSPDGSKVASVSGDTTVRLWTLPQELRVNARNAPKDLQAHLAANAWASVVVEGCQFGPPKGTVPIWLAGLNVSQRNLRGSDPEIADGVRQIRVESDGIVVLAVSQRWRGGGNRSGGWFEECKTRDDLLTEGWKEAGTLAGTPDGDLLVFWRVCRKGESFRIRTEKYIPPAIVQPPQQK